MTVPTPQSAAALLAEVEAARARVRREASPASSGFLASLGCASAGFFFAQSIADSDRAVVATAVVFVSAVLGAVVALVTGRRTTRQGFTQRFGVAMGAWAVVFAVGLSVGTTAEAAHGWSYWTPLAALVALPCLVGAWREWPR